MMAAWIPDRVRDDDYCYDLHCHALDLDEAIVGPVVEFGLCQTTIEYPNHHDLE